VPLILPLPKSPKKPNKKPNSVDQNKPWKEGQHMHAVQQFHGHHQIVQQLSSERWRRWLLRSPVVVVVVAAATVVAAVMRKRCTMTFVLCMIQLWSQIVKLESWCVSSLAGQFFLLPPLLPLSIQLFDQSSPHKYCIPILPLLVTCKQNPILLQNSHSLISLDQLAFSLQHSSSPGSVWVQLLER